MVFDLNFFGAVKTTQVVVPAMQQRGGGRIINISSIYGRESGGSMTYNASKASMNSWSKGLAKQLAKDNILVNVVAPGSILFPGGSWERRQNEQPESPTLSRRKCPWAGLAARRKYRPWWRFSPPNAPRS